MEMSEAVRIIRDVDADSGRKNRVLGGLQILSRHTDTEPEFAHDVIWAGGLFDDVIKSMSEDEVREMAALGWFYGSESDSWAHF